MLRCKINSNLYVRRLASRGNKAYRTDSRAKDLAKLVHLIRSLLIASYGHR